ncbi:MAG: hypothetical protein ACLRQZ_07530 [Clostridia bacterium]
MFNLMVNFDAIRSRNVDNDTEEVASEIIGKPHQRIFFGAPGTGKS